MRKLVIFASLAMFVLGFLDDLRPLGARKKFVGQILIALGFLMMMPYRRA